ncbi:MAG: proline--tRNA ligase [Thermotogae bacterium]|nr:proline--tRNA ligase [Thermotogota bacterium]
MRQSKSLIRTYREPPADAETKSHRLLVRGGYVRQLTSGVYTFLPLGWRVMKRIMEIIRQEMDAIGAQELFMPSLTSSSLWEESGRWESFGDDMFRLRDRKGRDYALAPTHEEIISEIARNVIHSYKDLPQIWYQLQTKFRDEPRPRGGLLRVREFIMKDSYSLDATWEGLDESYAKHRKAYERIFTRCGLKFVHVKASSGLMGGKESEEFMVISDAGEDRLVLCDSCGYAANVEVAPAIPEERVEESPFKELKKVHTPNVRSIEEVSEFLGVEPKFLVKSLVYMTDEGPVLVLVRGDHEVNEEKLARILPNPRLATADEVLSLLGVEVGFVGPLNVSLPKIADHAVRYLRGFVVGAGEEDHHIVGVNPEDLGDVRWEDIRYATEGDRCPVCGSPLRLVNAIEIGHIFKLGTRYSESMGVFFSDRDGQRKPVIMGSYGIGPGRIMVSAVELYGTENSMLWPKSIAPFDVHIVDLVGEGEEIYDLLRRAGYDVLWDEREERAGVKFKDADLIGVPLRIVIGRAWKDGKVELQDLWAQERLELPKERLLEVLKERLSRP